MKQVGILEALGESLASELLDKPASFTGTVLRAAQSSSQLHPSLDVLAISPRYQWDETQALPTGRLLLLPGNNSALIRHIQATCVMSYGSSPKDTLTLSSLAAHGLTLSIQRELVTLAGGTVERQEVRLSPISGRDPMDLLFHGGMLLLLGIPATELHLLL